MAAKVPPMVAMTVASRDTSRVVYTLRMMMRSRNSSRYQFREKPSQTALLLPALKEKTISRMMGAYRNRNTTAMEMRLKVELRFFIASPPVLRPHRSGS